MGNECTHLNEFDSPCKLNHCVQSGTVTSKNSVSPSIQMLLSMQPLTRVYDTRVQSVFLKSFVNIWALDQNNLPPWIRGKINSLKGLYYELTMNMSVIKPLVEQKICPYFVTIYTGSYNCSYRDLAQLVGNQAENLPELLSNGFEDADVRWFTRQDIKYCFLLSQVMTGETMHGWIQTKGKNRQNIAKVLFQVAVACYMLELVGVSHNDLHGGNVFVSPESKIGYHDTYYLCLPATPPIIDVVKDSSYRARVYDFDQAAFGPYMNPFVTYFVNRMAQQGMSGEFHSHRPVPGKDFLHFLLSVTRHLGNNTTKFVNWFFPLLAPPEAQDLLKSHLTQKKAPYDKALLNNLTPLPQVIAALANMGGITSLATLPTPDPQNTFRVWGALDSTVFTPQGHVKPATVRDQLLQKVRQLPPKQFLENEKEMYLYDKNQL